MRKFVEPQMERLPFCMEDVITASAEPTEPSPTGPIIPETPGDDFD